MGEYSFIWNVTGYPSGVMPITNVQSDEQSFEDTHNDSWTRLIQSNCAGSEGLPVCIQVTAYSFEDEKCLGVMAAIEKEIRYKMKIHENDINLEEYEEFKN